MIPYTLADAAIDDLTDAWNYVATKDGEVSADRLLSHIMQGIEFLRTMPKSGRPRPDLGLRGLRGWTRGSYLILYRVRADDLHVLRVLHGARDLQKLVWLGENE